MVLLFLSGSDLMVIMFVALLLFGGDKLPELARGLGKGIRDFKDASEGVKREINNQINSYEEKKAEQAAANAAPAEPAALPPADEHSATTHISAEGTHDDNAPNPITATYGGVANTMPFVENHGIEANNEVSDEHAEAPKQQAGNETEPVKTTHV